MHLVIAKSGLENGVIKSVRIDVDIQLTGPAFIPSRFDVNVHKSVHIGFDPEWDESNMRWPEGCDWVRIKTSYEKRRFVDAIRSGASKRTRAMV